MIQPSANKIDTRPIALDTLQPKAARTDSNQVPVKGDQFSSEQTQQLQQILSANPEVRPEVVERARKLANDPTYPPKEVIHQISKLLVDSQDPSEQIH